jgi:ATP/maltotriose-dependent transcriptional regulator MalT/DNA-binding SARP family transcriptional activator
MLDARTISKTILPDLSRAIARPRLIRQISAAGHPRVILISGQAAQGKSTLAAEIARQSGPAAAWMHLDAADSDPVNFFRLLVRAIEAARPSPDASVFLKNPVIALGPEAGSSRIAEIADIFLAQAIAREPVRIVIDGLDALADNAASLALVDRMVDTIYPPSCLVLVSRETPTLKLESLRIHQELVVLTNDDLAFTTEEIFHFFRDLYHLRLAPSQLARIREITDGWAGGLVLVWEALSHVPEDQRLAFIDSGLPAAMRGERLAYFSEAVFAGLDEATRHFLIRSAIFDTFDRQLIARYLENESVDHGDAVIDTMVRQNWFIQPLFDVKTGWGYRYNQLFRDFLLEKFHTLIDKPEQRALLIKAADLAWNAKNFEGAIRFFLQAESFEKAAAGIKKIAMGLSAQGRFADLAGWIGLLPDAMIQDDAWLSFYRAVGQRIGGGRRNLHAFSQAFERFTAQTDQRGQLLALAYLIEAAVFLGHPQAALNRWLETARAMLDRVSGNRYYPLAKAALWMQVAFGILSGGGDLQKGLSACHNAMLLAGTIRDDSLTVNATIIRVFGLTLAGEFAAAEKALTAIRDLVVAAYPEYRALQNIVRMELALSQGDLDRAQDWLDANQEDIDKFGLLFLYPIHVDLCGLLQIHQGRFDAVGRTAAHLKDVATLAANPFYNGLALRLQALNAYHQRRFDQAHQAAGQAAKVVAGSLGESIHLYRCRLILGMAAYHLGDLDAARQALEPARDFFSRVASHLSLAETQLGLSLVAAASGHGREAARHMESALALVASQGYKAFPILSARDVLAACQPALEHARSDITDLACRLVFLLRTKDPAPARDNGTHPVTVTRHSAATVGFDGARFLLDIRTLGGFEVRRHSGEVIAQAEWSGLRQLLLLKAILVNGCREIPKDILMDALWPDSSYDAALRCFKVTLHRLRRILEPDGNQRAGWSCLFLKDNRVSLDTERCRVDAIDFLAACDDIRQLKRADDDDRILSACRRAAEIYRGDFLPEELYLSWAELKRAALRDQYLAVLMEMAGRLEKKDDLDQAARYLRIVIRTDPLAEKAHQQLMRLFQRQGRRSAALKLYRDLSATLAAELDTVPDPSTTRIYQEISKIDK